MSGDPPDYADDNKRNQTVYKVVPAKVHRADPNDSSVKRDDYVAFYEAAAMTTYQKKSAMPESAVLDTRAENIGFMVG